MCVCVCVCKSLNNMKHLLQKVEYYYCKHSRPSTVKHAPPPPPS